MSRSFDIILDKLSEFYQAFNICAVQVYDRQVTNIGGQKDRRSKKIQRNTS